MTPSFHKIFFVRHYEFQLHKRNLNFCDTTLAAKTNI